MSRIRVLPLSVVCLAIVAACSSSPPTDLLLEDSNAAADEALDPAQLVADGVLPDPAVVAAPSIRSFEAEIDAAFDRPSGTVLVRSGSRSDGVDRVKEIELSWNRGAGTAVVRGAARATAEIVEVDGALLSELRNEMKNVATQLLAGVPMEERSPGSWQGLPPGTGGLMVVDLTLVDGMVGEIRRYAVGWSATAFDSIRLID